MGLTLTAKYKDAPEWDMGYGSFFRLRRDIAYTISKEFDTWYFLRRIFVISSYSS